MFASLYECIVYEINFDFHKRAYIHLRPYTFIHPNFQYVAKSTRNCSFFLLSKIFFFWEKKKTCKRKFFLQRNI